jgi:hypothetical protein
MSITLPPSFFNVRGCWHSSTVSRGRTPLAMPAKVTTPDMPRPCEVRRIVRRPHRHNLECFEVEERANKGRLRDKTKEVL